MCHGEKFSSILNSLLESSLPTHILLMLRPGICPPFLPAPLPQTHPPIHSPSSLVPHSALKVDFLPVLTDTSRLFPLLQPHFPPHFLIPGCSGFLSVPLIRPHPLGLNSHRHPHPKLPLGVPPSPPQSSYCLEPGAHYSPAISLYFYYVLCILKQYIYCSWSSNNRFITLMRCKRNSCLYQLA